MCMLRKEYWSAAFFLRLSNFPHTEILKHNKSRANTAKSKHSLPKKQQHWRYKLLLQCLHPFLLLCANIHMVSKYCFLERMFTKLASVADETEIVNVSSSGPYPSYKFKTNQLEKKGKLPLSNRSLKSACDHCTPWLKWFDWRARVAWHSWRWQSVFSVHILDSYKHCYWTSSEILDMLALQNVITL